MKRWRIAGLVLVGAIVVMQLVPYGWRRTNPPVRSEPAWDSPRTERLFGRACADCHSNETKWPWYSYVAPVSWLVISDVEEAREHFNVSEWGRDDENEGDEAAEMVREGEMPLDIYLLAHSEARLSDQERTDLIAGLVRTFGED